MIRWEKCHLATRLNHVVAAVEGGTSAINGRLQHQRGLVRYRYVCHPPHRFSRLQYQRGLVMFAILRIVATTRAAIVCSKTSCNRAFPRPSTNSDSHQDLPALLGNLCTERGRRRGPPRGEDSNCRLQVVEGSDPISPSLSSPSSHHQSSS